MYFSGSWNYNAFTTDITGFEWGVMPSPVGSVSGSAILGGSGLAVPENSANKDLALSFIKWFYEEENFSYYLDLDKGLSSLTGVTYQPPTRRLPRTTRSCRRKSARRLPCSAWTNPPCGETIWTMSTAML